MPRAMNIVFGIGIAVVVYILILLGIQAFYPEPRYENYCNQTFAEPILDFVKCPDNITVGECRSTVTTNEKEIQKCNDDYNTASRAYNKNFFIIAAVLGTIVVIAAFFIMKTPGISAGIASAGIVLIMWAFIRGWESTNDKLKFFVGLVIAAIVITLGVLVNKKAKK